MIYEVGLSVSTDVLSSILDILHEAFGIEGESVLPAITARMLLPSMYAQNIHLFVVEHDKRIVGVASLLIERKLLHNGSKVGHIEDVAIRKEFRGMGFGKQLIHYLVNYAESKNCRKVILDAAEYNDGFYKKCGFMKTCGCYRYDLRV